MNMYYLSPDTAKLWLSAGPVPVVSARMLFVVRFWGQHDSTVLEIIQGWLVDDSETQDGLPQVALPIVSHSDHIVAFATTMVLPKSVCVPSCVLCRDSQQSVGNICREWWLQQPEHCRPVSGYPVTAFQAPLSCYLVVKHDGQCTHVYMWTSDPRTRVTSEAVATGRGMVLLWSYSGLDKILFGLNHVFIQVGMVVYGRDQIAFRSWMVASVSCLCRHQYCRPSTTLGDLSGLNTTGKSATLANQSCVCGRGP